MMTQLVDQQLFGQKARRIRMQVSAVLKKWGLIPRFKRWRLTQDPDTGMIVLFGVLNNKYIAAHTAIPFRDYFDPRLLHDLANELQVQVVSCNSDGLRYAFILDRGQLGKLPTIDASATTLHHRGEENLCCVTGRLGRVARGAAFGKILQRH